MNWLWTGIALLFLVFLGFLLYHKYAPEVPGKAVDLCRASIREHIARRAVAALPDEVQIADLSHLDLPPDITEQRIHRRSQRRYRVVFTFYLLEPSGKGWRVYGECLFQPHKTTILNPGDTRVSRFRDDLQDGLH